MLGSNLHAKRRKLMQGEGNMPPQQPQQSPAFGLFSQAFEKPKMTLGDKLGMLGGRLMDMDGTLGSGNYAMAKDAYDTRVGEARDEFGQNQQRQLMMMAAQGDPMALFMLDPNAALAEKRADKNFEYQQGRDSTLDARYADDTQYARGRDAVADDRWQQGFQRENDWRAQDVQYRDARANRQDLVDDRNYDRGVLESDRGYGETVRQFDLNYGLDRDKLTADAAKDAAEQARTPATLQGLPAGVQSAIVKNELDNIGSASTASQSAEKAATLAKQFMDESAGYGSLGGGWLADVGQAFSQKTARLKGITAEMIPMMRTAGEGIMTDADAKRYESAVVSINKGRGANQDVADVLEAGKQNAKAYEQFLREWQAQGGYGDQQTAELLWDQYSEEVPMFDPQSGQPNMGRMPIREWLATKQREAEIDAELEALMAEEGAQ